MDLRGKYPKDTYQYLVTTDGSTLFDGQNNRLNTVSSSYASSSTSADQVKVNVLSSGGTYTLTYITAGLSPGLNTQQVCTSENIQVSPTSGEITATSFVATAGASFATGLATIDGTTGAATFANNNVSIDQYGNGKFNQLWSIFATGAGLTVGPNDIQNYFLDSGIPTTQSLSTGFANGQRVTFVQLNNTTSSIVPSGGDTINGQSNYNLYGIYSYVHLVYSDSGVWIVIGQTPH